MKIKRIIMLCISFICLICAFSEASKLDNIYKSISLRFSSVITKENMQQALKYANSDKNKSALYPTFYCEAKGEIKNELRSVDAIGISVLGDSALAYAARFISGGYPQNDSTTCAISSQLAKQLFGSTDIIGQNIMWQGREYSITGVFHEKKPLAILIADGSEAFTCIELYGEMPQDKSVAAIEFARNAGLGTPSNILYGPDIAFLAYALCYLPIAILVLASIAALYTKSKAWPKKRRKLFLLAIAIAIALMLPTLFSQMPLWLIPPKWSDFSFWTRLADLIILRIEEYFMLTPFLKDVEAKFCILRLITSIGLLAMVNLLSSNSLWHSLKKRLVNSTANTPITPTAPPSKNNNEM